MSGKDFRIHIVQAIGPSEKASNLIDMIDVLAEARAEARGESPSPADYQFSAKVLCVLSRSGQAEYLPRRDAEGTAGVPRNRER